ncbi:MAG: sodium/proline symporter [Thermotogae bacterium]|nr:sodium/proline symporter [Thermotogota bacterium]
MNGVALGLILYIVLMLFIGAYTYRYMRTIEDFLLGGRRLGALVIAFSERASGESAWFLLGLPGFAYAMGMSVFWTVIGVALGIFVSWTVIAKRLRWETEKYGALTIPDYFEAKFKDDSRLLRIASTAIILLFYLFYLGAQIIGAGKILNATFGIDQTLGMLIGASVVALYTMAGGFTAVALTDLVQGVIMLVAAVLLPILGIAAIGGVGEMLSKLQSMDPNFLSITGGKAGRDLLVGTILGGMGVGLGYMGQPHLLTRYMAIRSTREVKKGVLIAMLWVLLAYWGAPFIGIVGKAYFGPEIADAEHVMPMLATAVLPPIVAGFVIAGAVAAMMSTADSQLLVVTSAVVEDIYRKLLGRDLSQRALVSFSRWITLGITAFALVLALFAKNLIYWLVLYAWSGLGASFGPPLLLSLLWKGTTRWGVLAGMLVGTLTTIIWYNVPLLKGTVYELIPAFTFSLLATWAVSRMTRKD